MFKKINELVIKGVLLASKHKRKINFFESMIDKASAMLPATETNYLHLANGIINAFNGFIDSVYFSHNDFISIRNLETLVLNSYLASFARELFINHSATINFGSGDQILIHKTELGDIYLLKDRFNSPINTIYFDPKIITKDNLIQFIIKSKTKNITENFIHLNYDNNSFIIKNLYPKIHTSELCKSIYNRIINFNNKNINRSILLKGQPGTGKTTLAYSILNDLKYRTLVFSASRNLLSYDLFLEVLDIFKIDAILIDDLDQFQQSNRLIDLIEFFNQKCKVLIGIVNSTAEMHPALLRPGRFDDIIMIEHLDNELIKNMLGDLDSHFDEVKHFPIAFISEFVKRHQVCPNLNVKESIKELSERLKSNTKNNNDNDNLVIND